MTLQDIIGEMRKVVEKGQHTALALTISWWADALTLLAGEAQQEIARLNEKLALDLDAALVRAEAAEVALAKALLAVWEVQHPQQEEPKKRKCPDCGEMCAHPWCGRCEKALPPEATQTAAQGDPDQPWGP